MELTRRQFMKVCGKSLLGLAASGAFVPQIVEAMERLPIRGLNNLRFKDYNLIFVSFDALQAAHTSCLGYFRQTTPTIDELAKKGFLFTQAISESSWTVPASMSWFTSMYPSEHRLLNKYTVRDDKLVFTRLCEVCPEAITLAEVLKDNGYTTGAFTGDAGVSARFGYGNGFDVYVDDVKFGGFDHSIPMAIEWLKKNTNKKLFMFLHGYDSHGQYDPPRGYTFRFLDFDYKGPLKGGKEEQARLREEGLEKGFITLSDEDVRFWRALYDEKINDADQRFKHFIDELDRLGLLDKTIIIITSDHGTAFYEHKRFDHGFDLYEELIHIPLLFYIPTLKKGESINEQVRGIDLMPTILELLDIESPQKAKEQMRGVSLIPLMRKETLNLTAYSETDYRLYVHKRSIRTPDGWKFIYDLETDRKELYNLKEDSKELRNLVDEQPRISYELEQYLFQWLKSMQTETGIHLYPKTEIKIREY